MTAKLHVFKPRKEIVTGSSTGVHSITITLQPVCRIHNETCYGGLAGDLPVGGYNVNNLRYATSVADMAELLKRVKVESELLSLRPNVSKTKNMAIGPDSVEEPFIIDSIEVESVSKFNFLGSLVTKDGGCSQEIRHWLAMARSAMTNLSKIWADRGITRTTKVRLDQALVFLVALYVSVTWTLNKADRNRIAAFEMWCWRCMLHIPWTMRRTSASILEEIGVSNWLLHTNNIQMLRYFGHIARHKGNNLEKVIMQGMIEGKRRKGWPRSRWIDQIRSAIGRTLRDCYALAKDRHLWRRMYEVTSCQPWQERTNQPAFICDENPKICEIAPKAGTYG